MTVINYKVISAFQLTIVVGERAIVGATLGGCTNALLHEEPKVEVERLKLLARHIDAIALAIESSAEYAGNFFKEKCGEECFNVNP